MSDAMRVACFLNELDAAAARRELTTCCAAGAWVDAMLARRPYANDDDLMAAAEQAASALEAGDWLEAFAAHPLIGDVATLREKYAATKELAAAEQSGVAGAANATIQELAGLNRAYRERFGFIFIVFATGKTADQMLAILKSRMDNSRDEELRGAAEEQLKITRLRLSRLAKRAGDP
jgi:OHCU decarboxylase